MLHRLDKIFISAKADMGYKSVKTAVFIACCIILCMVFPTEEIQAAQRLQNMDENIVIVIDPGHGGENEGTIENGFQEKSMTMKTASAMYDLLSQYDNVTVYLTRTEDKDLTLKERAEFAAQVEADFLFSIHYNASPNHNLFGSEVWISAQEPFNAYGYQFGITHLRQMQDMGLFLRGVKTRLNDKGTDYYGIIRESAALGIPAVIIEHCHVDENTDVPFCDSEEALQTFGQADARSVAEYFGLTSASLGNDYSQDALSLPDVPASGVVQRSLKDETGPDVCQITMNKADYDTGHIEIEVSAADYDSMLLYYDYSIDGGETFTALRPWPGSDAITGEYTDTFQLDITVPSGEIPVILLRAYNLFDASTESNTLADFKVFNYGQEENLDAKDPGPVELPETEKEGQNTEITPATSGQEQKKSTAASLLSFLKICLICTAALFVIVLISQLISASQRRRRRQRRIAEKNKSSKKTPR